MSRPLLLPRALPIGGTLGIVAPASPPDAERLERAREALHREGFRTLLAPGVFERYGHHAGSEACRAAGLHALFADPQVDAILCARGGNGSLRLLPHLDWELIRAHPKPFLGYSDITTLCLALLAELGMPTFFAPMATSDWADPLLPCCRETLWRLVCRAEPAGLLPDPRCGEATCLVEGTAEGPLVGGTLSLFAALIGTRWEPDLSGCLFFFEDVDESPARMERYLTQLLLGGRLDHVAGFLIGNAPWDNPKAERQLSLEQVYRDLLVPLARPLVYGWPNGHDASPMTLPVGVRARLDAAARTLTVLEPAVR